MIYKLAFLRESVSFDETFEFSPERCDNRRSIDMCLSGVKPFFESALRA